MRVEIDLFSDFIRPWSYIDKRRLDRALGALAIEHPDADVLVLWAPCFLDPDIPPQGRPFRTSLEAKLGGAAGAEAKMAQVREAGRKAGVGFAPERIAILPNTLHAHRLIYKAQADRLPQVMHRRVAGMQTGDRPE